MKNRFFILLVTLLTLHFIAAAAMASEARLRASDLGSKDILESDIKAEIEFGRELAARILATNPLVEDPTTQYYVNLVGSAVTMSAGRTDIGFYFAVIESETPNAFAVPGGYVFITSAALDLIQNESELAGVLGHEIGHVTSKHIVKELNIRGEDGSTLAGLSAIIGGSTASVREALDKTLDSAFDILFKRGYKMADELEADQIGVILAAFAGYDPAGLKNFLSRVTKFEAPPSDHKGDHPAHQVRINAIEETLKANGVNPITYSKGEKRFHEKLAD